MIKRIKEKNYKFIHPLGTITVDEVELGISEKGRRSLSASEIDRLVKIVALEFLKSNYRKALERPDFTISSDEVRSIMNFLNVNGSEFGILIGCQKSKVSKILRNEQKISTSQALLALERLALELVRHGAIRSMLGHNEVKIAEPDQRVVKEINRMRFAA